MKKIMVVIAGVALTSSAALAQQGMGGRGGMGGTPGMGPVAQQCNDDAASLCPGKAHQNRELRTCLEQNIARVAPACRDALKSTGPGRRP